MPVTLTSLPEQSALHTYVGEGDFLDCYSVPSNMPARPAAAIITAFPGWARALLQVRRLITAPFGLSQDGPEAEDKLGPFPVELDTGDEVIAGFDDKHLNFRVSVCSQGGRVSLATWVHPHNTGGRLYLATIMPFHILVVRNALARVARADLGATPA
ncbi:DUF2867 domain-containing protein [uncultured Tateyamaria sp.]|uniref:DUF2867 domain-containing protein n=1 Tax=uncultured Tateyamaria sp. TaxID=455651 RepID=UPI0026396E06|nr:DUF2867 domain-containing protein [uncultured Tateyamaria sp.]